MILLINTQLFCSSACSVLLTSRVSFCLALDVWLCPFYVIQFQLQQWLCFRIYERKEGAFCVCYSFGLCRFVLVVFGVLSQWKGLDFSGYFCEALGRWKKIKIRIFLVFLALLWGSNGCWFMLGRMWEKCGIFLVLLVLSLG